MCLRTIKIDDTLLEQVKSALLTYTSKQKTEMPCSYTDEEMYGIIKERLQSLEDGTATLVDGEEVLSQIQERYGFKA